VDVCRHVTRLLARHDDRRPRRQIGREHAAEALDDGTGITLRKEAQSADQRDMLAGKGSIVKWRYSQGSTVKMKLSYVVVKISLSKAWELGSQEAWE
jgi:hypothetical protein